MVIWQLRDSADERRERLALRLIGIAFVGLAIYVAVQAAYTLLAAARPQPSPLGIGWTVATYAAMLALAVGRSARRLGHRLLRAARGEGGAGLSAEGEAGDHRQALRRARPQLGQPRGTGAAEDEAKD